MQNIPSHHWFFNVLLVLEDPAIAGRFCVVKWHLLASITALCNSQHRANARDVCSAVRPSVQCPVCLPLLYCTFRVTADPTPQHQPAGKLCSGQNDGAKSNGNVMGQGRAGQRKPGWLCRMEAVQCHWLWCCLEKAPRVPGCDILLTAACLEPGGSQGACQQVPAQQLQHHCAATSLLTFLSVYTLSRAAGRIQTWWTEIPLTNTWTWWTLLWVIP